MDSDSGRMQPILNLKHQMCVGVVALVIFVSEMG